MKCTEKWFKQQIQDKAKTTDWIDADRHLQIDNLQSLPEEKFQLWKKIGEEEWVRLDFVLGLFVEREKELQEKLLWLGRMRGQVREIETNMLLGEKMQLIKEILGEG